MAYSIAAVQNAMSALETNLKNVVVPVLEDKPDRDINQIGTSTLISHNDKTILLSAMHVFDRVEALQIAVPSDCMGSRVVPLWPFEIVVSDDKNDDLIALVLNGAVSNELRTGWRVINSHDCASPRGDQAYAISGYPSKLVKKFGPKMGGTLVTAYTDLMSSAPANAIAPVDERDIFFEYNEEATRGDGTTIRSPRLQGVSGAGIWEIQVPNGKEFWTPQNALTLVGVETDTRHFEYIRGKTWKTVVERLLVKL